MFKEKKRTLLNITTIPIYIRAQEVPVTQMHSDDVLVNKFLIENRTTLVDKVYGFDYKSEAVTASKYGNTEYLTKINSNLDSLTRKIQLFSASCEISDYHLHGRVCAAPKLAITVYKYDGQIQGSMNLAYQVAGGLERVYSSRMTAERLKQLEQNIVIQMPKETGSGDESSGGGTSSEDVGGKEEGQDDIDCQEQKDAKLRDEEEWEKIDEEIQYRDKYEQNALAGRNRRTRQ